MGEKVNIKTLVLGLAKFFPIHILIAHLKRNLLGVFYWIFLFAIVSNNFGSSFGIPYLFYSPEYLGETNCFSFLLLGFSIGGFIMAFHTYSYIRLGPLFPFIATLSRPFFKFCVNNSVLPFIFSVFLAYKIYKVQSFEEMNTSSDVLLFITSFFCGLILFVLVSFLYFFPTNTDVFKIKSKKSKKGNIKSSLHKNTAWGEYYNTAEEKFYLYIGKGFRFKRSRGFKHYDYKVLQDVFSQNHINVSIFEITIIVSFFLMGYLSSNEYLQVPAGVSVMLLLTTVLMLISAFFSWFKLWTYPILILGFVGMNYLSKTTDYFQFKNFAYGLSYAEETVTKYNKESLSKLYANQETVNNDRKNIHFLLNNWKRKQKLKPKLVIVNTSGGGLRSSLWTYSVLAKLDKMSDGEFTKSIQMITGASGGMIGASYYRELMRLGEGNLQKIRFYNDSIYSDRISKDLLNKMSFTISTNDIFLRYRKEKIGKYEYTVDRGFSFEEQLNQNTKGVLKKNLGDYKTQEANGEIPLMIYSPTIINDGRRLLIASQPLGFMFDTEKSWRNQFIQENVEYRKLFKQNNPDELNFTTVLRMNATFPYIMPMVSMPTEPTINVMDAGLRDNYGTKTTVQYLESLKDWIDNNTSGVVIVQIRDTKKDLNESRYKEFSLSDKLTEPFTNIYGNFPSVHDYEQDELLNLFTKSVPFSVDIISFNLRERAEDKIALSWHLTKQEKEKIKKSLNSTLNVREYKRLFELLGTNYGGKSGQIGTRTAKKEVRAFVQ